MNDLVDTTETKPITSMELPLSIKLIAGYLILTTVPAILIGLAYVFEFGLGIGKYDGLIFLISVIFISFAPLFIGLGLLKRNKIAWYTSLILHVFLVFLISFAALKTKQVSIMLVINALIIWKLWEHKRAFGI